MKRMVDTAIGYGLGSRLAHDAMMDEAERCKVTLGFVQYAWRRGRSVEQQLNIIVAQQFWGWCDDTLH